MRSARHETGGGTYHVFNRGNNGLHVFRDDDDRGAWVAHLSWLARELRWSVLSYCVLGTHFHLLVRTSEPTLGVGMRDLSSRAATALHSRYGTRGRVWEDRFKSKIVDRDAYLLHLFRYVALNPVHAGLCDGPGGWSRSAHRTLLAGAPDGIVDLPVVGEMLGAESYAYLFDERGRHGPWSNAKHPEMPRPPLDVVLADGPLVAAMTRARFAYGYKLKEIAHAAGVSHSYVSVHTRRARQEGTVPS